MTYDLWHYEIQLQYANGKFQDIKNHYPLIIIMMMTMMMMMMMIIIIITMIMIMMTKIIF